MALCEAFGGLTAGSEAEEMAVAAHLAGRKKDASALHALVHVLDLGGRASEGASLLRQTRDFWEALPDPATSVHFAAHLTRFYIERGNYKAAADRPL